MEIAPEIEGWHCNDGDGINGQNSAALADALQREIDSGRCMRWAKIRASALERLPNEPCYLCEATGTRKALPEIVPGDEDKLFPRYKGPIEIGAGDPATGFKCNGCNGEGYTRPDACRYGFSVENVQEFVTFLRSSGGFVIR